MYIHALSHTHVGKRERGGRVRFESRVVPMASRIVPMAWAGAWLWTRRRRGWAWGLWVRPACGILGNTQSKVHVYVLFLFFVCARAFVRMCL